MCAKRDTAYCPALRFTPSSDPNRVTSHLFGYCPPHQPRELKRTVFGFGKSSRDPLADARTADRWLASFPAGDPLALHAEVVAELGRAADRNAERSPQRLEAIFHLDTQTRSLCRNLIAQYIEHAARSSKIENQLWQALFDLTQSFLVCYGAYAREIAERGQSAKWQALLPETVARQIRHLGLDAKVRLFRYEPWIPAKWMELHDIFAFACSRQIERRPLTLDGGPDTTTIERQYLVVLVLQLLNTGSLAPRQIAAIADQLDEWCESLRLAIEAPPVPAFYVDLASRTGLRRRGPAPLEGRALFLDTRPLHALLREHLAGLEHKVRLDPLSDKTGRRTEQHALYAKLAAQADPEFRPFARRGERAPATGEVDAIIGFGKITGFLREEERMPIPEFEPGHNYGATMELAVFGHMRNEIDRRRELVHHRLESYAAAGGPWAVKDMSQSGFRLVAPMDVATSITLGTLTALRAVGQSTWTLGVVRRLRRLTSERAEVGLQIIANTLIVVTLAEPRKVTDAGYSVDGEAAETSERTFNALFLALRKRDSDASVQSLIVPEGDYQPSRRFRLQTPKTSCTIRFGSLLEQGSDWTWTAIEPVELGATRSTPPSSTQ